MGGRTTIFACLACAAIAIATGAAAIGCQGSSATPDAGAPDAIQTYASSTCGTCVAQACEAQITACNGDPDCAAYLKCVNACPIGKTGDVESACEAACPRGSSTAAASAVTWLTQCRSTGAGAKCTGCGGSIGDGGFPLTHQMCTPSMDPNMCFRCDDDHCCDTYTACKANPECGAFRTCIQGCNVGMPDEAGAPATLPDAAASGACDFYCYAKHPTGLKEWAPRITCVGIFCTKECGGTPTPCLTCTYTECRDEWAATNSIPDGYMLNACAAGCPKNDLTCTQKCFDQYPKLRPLYDALGLCLKARCSVCD